MQLFNSILQGSENQPIIIFPADHGNLYSRIRGTDLRKSYVDIYAAYYLPDKNQVELPKAFTLVNTFPLILNEVFEADFETRGNRLLEVLN